MGVTRHTRRVSIVAFLLAVAFPAALSLSGCGPLPSGEYWKGSYLHLYPPRYTFEVPPGWREAKPVDFGSLAFNRRAFAALDDAQRRAFLEQAELQIQALDTGLISDSGAWIQIGSEANSGGWYSGGNPFALDPLRFGLSAKEKDALWERFAASRVQRAPQNDKPKLTLELIDVVTYGLNRVIRMRFTSEEARGSMHWTVLAVYSVTDTVSLAHLGTPENRDDGLDALETIVTSLRFN
jgi:hypothetical protein